MQATPKQKRMPRVRPSIQRGVRCPELFWAYEEPSRRVIRLKKLPMDHVKPASRAYVA